MSCTLFSKASYDALANRPTIRLMHRDLLAYHYETPAAFVAALFEFNAAAFLDRYGEGAAADVEQARVEEHIDGDFLPFLNCDRFGSEPLVLAMLHRLLGRIHYQVCDTTNFELLEMTRHLHWCQHWVADQMANVINQRIPQSELNQLSDPRRRQ